MSTFRPEFREVQPADPPDLLAGALLRNLTREIPIHHEWRAAKTMFVALLSFGTLPVIAWTRKFKYTADLERQQYWHLAEWVRLQSGHPDGDRLTKLATRTGYRRWIGVIAWTLVGIVIFQFSKAFNDFGVDWTDLKGATYAYGKVKMNHFPPHVAQQLFIEWCILLSVAYVLHWIQIQSHVWRVRQFTRVLNEIVGGELIRPVEVHSIGIGVRPIWMTGAVVLTGVVGAVWAIPMSLVGVLHLRWRREGRRVRNAMADQLRQMLMLRRPSMSIPHLPNLGRFCANDVCRGLVPDQGRFCPRCGREVGRNGRAA